MLSDKIQGRFVFHVLDSCSRLVLSDIPLKETIECMTYNNGLYALKHIKVRSDWY